MGNLFVLFPLGHVIDFLTASGFDYDTPFNMGSLCTSDEGKKAFKKLVSSRCEFVAGGVGYLASELQAQSSQGKICTNITSEVTSPPIVYWLKKEFKLTDRHQYYKCCVR